MRAAIYNPYLDTLGGGERYTFSFANALLNKGYSVDVEWSSKTINPKRFWRSSGRKMRNLGKVNLDNVNKRYGLNLKGIKFVDDIKRGDSYDVCFWVSDGSIPTLRSRKNFLHFQVPFKGVSGNTLINKMKLFRINKVICNSNFTKEVIDKEYGVDSLVIYPPVDVKQFSSKAKRKYILSVGRFSQLKQAKRQDVLISAYKIFSKQKLSKGWRLILAGGTEVGAKNNIRKLKKLSQGYQIEFIENPDFKTLIRLYSHASIFWSASGFSIDEKKLPEKLEHFGITLVEAMASGCVAIAYNKGGSLEIIEDRKDGFLFGKKSELIKISSNLIENKKLLNRLSKKAQKKAGNFSLEKFNEQVYKII